jgi:urease accessory protein
MSPDETIAHLRLLQLSDSALPIGAQAHSFGLEALVASELLSPANLETFLTGYLSEQGRQEAGFCRLAYRLAGDPALPARWIDLNRRLSALRSARETRAASATLGRRFLLLISTLEPDNRLDVAVQQARSQDADIHLCAAFGLAGGVLRLGEDQTVLAYLRQSLTGMCSALQRLLPVGQQATATLLWRLQPAMILAAGAGSRSQIGVENEEATRDEPIAFMPLLELASMRHPRLPVRLFVS